MDKSERSDVRRALLPLLLLGVGCAGQQHGSTTPSSGEVRDLEEMRITARQNEDGSFAMGAYDAEMLFQAGVREMRAGHCAEAVEHYDRVADEFASSRFVSPSLYNAGLCLKEAEEREASAQRFERLLRDVPGSRDVKHTRFQLMELYLELERWEDGQQMADTLLERDDLSSDERVEAMARKAQLHLGAEHAREARGQARRTLAYARRRPEDDRVRDVYFTAAANYVLAETFRLEADGVAIPPGGVAEQRPVLERRAQLILDAQREYFNTIRTRHAYWAAASGYRIGNMYENFWDAIMSAPVPPPREPLEGELLDVYHDEYRTSLARLVKPLVRHSIRYWELTLLMVERTGVNSEWTTRIREDLERMRGRLLEQPDGPEGMDSVSAPEGSDSDEEEAPPASPE
ncbi:MAG: tetratricopeptide repeat protein [Myxococcota bacterium]